MEKKICHIASIQSGVYLKNDPEGDVIYLQVKDFYSDGNISDCLEASIKDENKLSKHLLCNGDLLFAAKGTSNFCTVYHESIGKAVASSSFFVIRPKQSIVNPEFLCWYLNTTTILKMLRANAVGTSIPSITKSMIEEVEIHVPSLEKQKSIVLISRLQQRESKILELLAIKKRLYTDSRLTQTIK
jgi:restriction endonuclease S subunit